MNFAGILLFHYWTVSSEFLAHLWGAYIKFMFSANVYHVPGLCLLGIGGAPYISHKIMARKPFLTCSLKQPAGGAS